MDQNTVTFGIKNLHIAPIRNGVYATPIPVPGTIGWKPSPEGDKVEFYADNTLYYSATSNNGYTGDLETTLFPDLLLAELLSWYIDANKMIVEVSTGEQIEFAMMGEIDGDKRNRRFVYWQCKAARPSKEHKTTEKSKEPATDVISITSTPKVINGKSVVKGVIELDDTNAAIYNSFFDAVVLPDATPSTVTKVELAKVIAIAGKLDEADYTAGSWTTFEAVLTASTAVNNNVSATQQQVNTATTNLKEAILDLVTV